MRDKPIERGYEKTILIFLILLLAFIVYGCVGKINSDLLNKSKKDVKIDSDFSVKKTHFGFLAGEINDTRFDYEDIANLGITLIKPFPGPFIWENAEKQKNVYDFEKIDKVVRFFQVKNFSIVATIWPYNENDQANCNPPFCLADENNLNNQLPKSRCKPCDMNSYLTFLNLIVDRYDNDSHNDMENLMNPIQYWEVLNEPDSEVSQWFIGSGIDYLNLQIFSYEIIKKAFPDAKVLQSPASGASKINLDYWNTLYGRKLMDYFDTANIHSIDGKDELNSKEFNGLLKQNNINKTIWITDVKINGSEEDQAKKLFKGYIQAFANNAEVIFYGDYRDDELGIVYENDTKKESYFTLKTLVKKIGYFSDVEIINDQLYKFSIYEKNGNKFIYVTWAKIPKNIIKDWNTYLITSYTGTEKMVSSNDVPKMNINEPVYIEVIY